LTEETTVSTVTVHTLIRFGATGSCYQYGFSGAVELTNVSTGVVVASCPLYIDSTTHTFGPALPTGCLFLDVVPGVYLARASVSTEFFYGAIAVTVLEVQ
jgi:hypothetical protein